jgi:hypothetical protein
MASNLFYLSNSKYGGWVSFSIHLSYLLKQHLNKVSETGIGKGDVGYGIKYKNVPLGGLKLMENKLILALDKKHREFLPYFKGSSIVIHDPTELDTEVLKFLESCPQVLTIRQSVKEHLETLGIPSTFLQHPFYEYKKTPQETLGKAVSLSRVDYDKNTELIVQANNLGAGVDIYGAKNPFYYFHKLKPLGFDDWYKGEYSRSFKSHSKMYGGYEYLVDLSTIKNDGGGTQYTFLDADYWGQTIILHKNWITENSIFRDGENCYVVSSPEELVEALNKPKLKPNIMTTDNQNWIKLLK